MAVCGTRQISAAFLFLPPPVGRAKQPKTSSLGSVSYEMQICKSFVLIFIQMPGVEGGWYPVKLRALPMTQTAENCGENRYKNRCGGKGKTRFMNTLRRLSFSVYKNLGGMLFFSMLAASMDNVISP